jgi:hypothetical protein
MRPEVAVGQNIQLQPARKNNRADCQHRCLCLTAHNHGGLWLSARSHFLVFDAVTAQTQLHGLSIVRSGEPRVKQAQNFSTYRYPSRLIASWLTSRLVLTHVDRWTCVLAHQGRPRHATHSDLRPMYMAVTGINLLYIAGRSLPACRPHDTCRISACASSCELLMPGVREPQARPWS